MTVAKDGGAPTNEYPGQCEVCREPAVLVARIRMHHRDGQRSIGVHTSPDPGATSHPRCGTHASTSAYTIEGAKFPRWA